MTPPRDSIRRRLSAPVARIGIGTRSASERIRSGRSLARCVLTLTLVSRSMIHVWHGFSAGRLVSRGTRAREFTHADRQGVERTCPSVIRIATGEHATPQPVHGQPRRLAAIGSPCAAGTLFHNGDNGKCVFQESVWSRLRSGNTSIHADPTRTRLSQPRPPELRPTSAVPHQALVASILAWSFSRC